MRAAEEGDTDQGGAGLYVWTPSVAALWITVPEREVETTLRRDEYRGGAAVGVLLAAGSLPHEHAPLRLARCTPKAKEPFPCAASERQPLLQSGLRGSGWRGGVLMALRGFYRHPDFGHHRPLAPTAASISP